MNHGRDWDIKREVPWERTIRTPFPGESNTPIFEWS